MRLGFWNRLAVVGLGLALLIAPVAIVLKQNGDAFELAEVWKDHCMAGWEDQVLEPGYAAGVDQCFADYLKSSRAMTAGWDDYRDYLLGTAVVYALLYLLTGGVVAIGKWVWRGRRRAADA